MERPTMTLRSVPPPSAAPVSPYRLVPVHRLHANDGNPRTDPNVDADDLADSLLAVGLLEPLVVVAADPGEDVEEAHYTIVAGHRRLAALRVLDARLAEDERADAQDNGLLDPAATATARDLLRGVPVLVRDDLQDDRVLAALVENSQRVDLTPLEEARALRTLVDAGKTQAQVAELIGRSQGHVSKRLTVLDHLNGPLQRALERGELTLEQAVALARCKPATQTQAASRLSSGTAAQDVVAQARADDGKPPTKPRERPERQSDWEPEPAALPEPAAPAAEPEPHDPEPEADDEQDGTLRAMVGDVPAEPKGERDDAWDGDGGPTDAERRDEALGMARRATADDLYAALSAALGVEPVRYADAELAEAYALAQHHAVEAAHGMLAARLVGDAEEVPEGQGTIEDALPPAEDDMPLPVPLPPARFLEPTPPPPAEEPPPAATDGERAEVLDDAVEAWLDLGGAPASASSLKPGVKAPQMPCQGGCGRYARVAKGPVFGRHMLPGGLKVCPGSGQPAA